MATFVILGWCTRYHQVFNFWPFYRPPHTNAEIANKSSRHELSKDIFNRNDKSEHITYLDNVVRIIITCLVLTKKMQGESLILQRFLNCTFQSH